MAIVLMLPGCEIDERGMAPWAPSLPPAFGARVTDGQLRIWTGSACGGVGRGVVHVFVKFLPSAAELEVTAPDGTTVEHLAVGGPNPAMTVAKPLPPNFDWRKSDSVGVSVYPGGWGSETQLSTVVKESAQHPDDTYWFQDVGWLNPADVAAKDGKTFLATCTPDPKKAKKT